MSIDPWINYAGTAVLATVLCLLLTPFAKRIGLLDHPSERKVHQSSIPLVGGPAVYLASDAGACTTGEIIRVDGGYHVLGMPQGENL